MSNSSSGSGGGVGFLSLLSLVFITLKLTGVIDWSWWLVLMPIYLIPVLLVAGFVVYVAVKREKSRGR